MKHVIGMMVPPWTKDVCQCGSEYYITRSYEGVYTKRDQHCGDCNRAFDLDLKEKRLEQAEKIIQSLVEVADELNYRLRKTDQPEGFYGHIDAAKEFLKENK
ncbi:putative coil containing protein [Vibrio phage 249E41-1]|nr:putative coil containing protein [Vibrio phage 249E41-1]CAH9017091.1 putative coil containing protein [Vibrio phage 193E37-1]